MKRHFNEPRRGLSLLEVLVSFFVMLVGVVAVITLFPVGVLSVQRAVMDTRTTIVALDAQATVQMRRWLDDQYIVRPPHLGVAGGGPLATPNPAAGDARGILAASTPPYTGARPSSEIYPPPPGIPTVITPGLNNLYAAVPLADGQMPSFPANPITPSPARFHPMAQDGTGFPILVDPVLYNNRDFQFDTANPANTPVFKRVSISGNLTVAGTQYRSMAPFAGQLNDLVIAPLSDVQYQPVSANWVANGAVSQRDQYLRQNFFSNDLGHMEESFATAPFNPHRQRGTPLPAWRYLRSGDSNTVNTPATNDPPAADTPANGEVYNTFTRNLDYSWAFVIKNRKIHPQPAGATLGTNLVGPPAVTMPPYLVPTTNEWTNDNIEIMVFHKRAIGQGYHLIRGCFFNGSSVATLSWDPSDVVNPPNIVRGMWLMEATLSPGLRDTTAGPAGHPTNPGPAPLPPTSDVAAAVPPLAPATGYVKYRHAIEFHRVASVQDPVRDPNTGQMHQVVNLEKPVKNYPISHVLGDGRALPDLYEPETFSGNAAYPNFLPGPKAVPSGGPGFATAGAQVNTVWVPVVIWHGLAEVFTAKN